MYKSLLIASCAVLTASVFGMDSGGNYFKAYRERSNNFSMSPYQSPRINNLLLKKELAKKKRERNELASRNEHLVQENEVLIRECVESFKRLSLQSDEHKTKESQKTYEFVGNRLYFFEKIGNTNAYRRRATPTTVSSVAANWNNISEIRYAYDVSYDGLKNPKMIFYRNQDDSCYSILRIGDNKHGVFYGVNANDIEIGENSFSVYDVSQEMGSFTDNVLRQIYVDRSGLYFVPSAENPLESVIDTYQKEGKFDFNGSVLKVSAFDGSITFDGQPVTEKNFFDNWVQEEREVERQISKERGRTVIEKVKETKTVVSKRSPKPEEIVRNFYPPNGRYWGILIGKEKRELSYYTWLNDKWLGIFAESSIRNGKNEITTLGGREWINFFFDKRRQSTKEMNVQRCEELVRDGTFASILYRCVNDKNIFDMIVSQLMNNGGLTSCIKSNGCRHNYGPREIIQENLYKLRDPSFVKKLKQGFADIEKDYEYTKGTDLGLPFEIVRNL